MKYRWKNGAPKVVFITGGGSGLGRQFTKFLLAEGAQVAIFDLRVDEEILVEMNEIAGSAEKVAIFPVDITDASAVEAAVRDATAAFGAPDLALNCAGIAVSARFDKLPRESFEKVVAVNLLGTRNFAAAVLAVMKPGSHLALVASLAGKVGTYGYAAYNASKFGVVGLAECLRMEQKLRGIGVSVLCPGEIATPLVTEEAKHIDPIARAIKDTGGTLEVGPACDAMLRELAVGRFLVIPGCKSKLTNFIGTRFPGLLHSMVDRKAQKAANEIKRSTGPVKAL